jgi:hypothetical protein
LDAEKLKRVANTSRKVKSLLRESIPLSLALLWNVLPSRQDIIHHLEEFLRIIGRGMEVAGWLCFTDTLKRDDRRRTVLPERLNQMQLVFVRD